MAKAKSDLQAAPSLGGPPKTSSGIFFICSVMLPTPQSAALVGGKIVGKFNQGIESAWYLIKARRKIKKMWRNSFGVTRVIPMTFVMALSSYSQILRIGPGIAPGSETWTQRKTIGTSTPIGTVVFNVVTPTLTVYVPARTKATGTGIIIAPGGAFVALAVDLEGHSVARWLQDKGIAAFVLKYWIVEKRQDGIPDMNMDEAGKYGIADGIQALKFVRQHAAQWGISPNRVGFMGFSAGAMVTSGTLLRPDAAARPNFAAPIYGTPFGQMPAIPSGLPPIFLAWAQDDPLALNAVVKFYDALKSAGNKPEAHIFSAGGHGFGTRKQGTASDHWIDEFYYWLEAQGFAKTNQPCSTFR